MIRPLECEPHLINKPEAYPQSIMAPESIVAVKSGITNSPFAKNVITYWPMIRWILGIAAAIIFAYMTLWLRMELFTRDEGETLKETSYTKAEAKELEEDVEKNALAIVEIDHKFDIFQVEQKHHTEKLDEVIELVKGLHDHP